MAKPDAIKPLSRTNHTKLLVYGDPGVGKTRLAGGSPGKVLIIRPPVDHTDSIRLDGNNEVEEWVVSDWNEMNLGVMEYLRHEGHGYTWVWLDSISLWQDVGLDDIWDTVIREKPNRARYGLDQGEYGINMFRIGQWVRHIVGPDLFNFGITAHPVELPIRDDPESPEKLMPWIQGKNMSSKICGYMNMVGYYHLTNKGVRTLQFDETRRYYAKDQYDAFEGGRLLDPNMVKISDAIDKSRSARATKTRTRRRTRTAKGDKTTHGKNQV